jgi:tRNA(adenine34) deaminase
VEAEQVPAGEARFMGAAYALAEQAARQGEVPVGAVVVLNDQIIGEGFNQTLTRADPTAHAEIVALRDAAARLGNHRLVGTEVYVTIEPCTMCAGALIHARVARLYFGAREPRGGAVVSTLQALDNPLVNHRVHYQAGLCGEQCGALMSEFFRRRRA